jgi:hypothetical protein
LNNPNWGCSKFKKNNRVSNNLRNLRSKTPPTPCLHIQHIVSGGTHPQDDTPAPLSLDDAPTGCCLLAEEDCTLHVFPHTYFNFGDSRAYDVDVGRLKVPVTTTIIFA